MWQMEWSIQASVFSNHMDVCGLPDDSTHGEELQNPPPPENLIEN